MKTCAHCAAPHDRARAKYCCDLCQRRAYTERRKADGRLAEQREKLKGYSAAYQRANTERFRVDRECVVCGTVWRTLRKDAKYCSTACRGMMRDGAKRSTPIPDSHPARRGPTCDVPASHPARQTHYAPRLFVSGACRRCGKGFTVSDPSGRAVYCSASCSRADVRAKRRARMRDAFVAYVSPVAVYERDDWTCGLCGGAVLRAAKVPNPLAAVVDHVVSLANGGTHEPDNVQCAHFICNSRKGDRDDQPVPPPCLTAA